MWGDPKVSIKRLITNGSATFNPAGTPTTSTIGRAGILESVLLSFDGSATATLASAGSIVKDIWGPWNTFSQLSIIPNDGAPLRRHSGYSGYLDMLMRSIEGSMYAADVVTVAEGQAAALADIFAYPTTGSSQDFRFFIELPLTQRINSLEDTLGYFPTDNPQVSLNVNMTLAGSSSGTPFTLSSGGNTSASATLFPWFTDSGSTVTVATPTVDVRRTVWQTPMSDKDDPNFNYVIQTQEDTPQNSINGATQVTYRFTANSGVLLRVAIACIDGGSAVAESKMTNTNSLELLYGINEAKAQETGRAAHARMQRYYGFLFPEGVYSYDFLGKDLNLADSIDLSYLQDVRLNLNLSSALGSSASKAIVLHERLVPVGNARPAR